MWDVNKDGHVNKRTHRVLPYVSTFKTEENHILFAPQECQQKINRTNDIMVTGVISMITSFDVNY